MDDNHEVEERDCEHCKNHDGKYCQVWDCKFEPKEKKTYGEKIADEIIRKCF